MDKLNDRLDKTLKGDSTSGNTTKSNDRKKMFIVIVVAIVLLASLWIWKESQISNLQDEAEKQKQQQREQAMTLISHAHKQHLKLLAKPYVWAVRSELLKGNISQVNLYANEMVKESNFQSVVIANDKGVIVSSTNKKNEGQQFLSIGKQEYLVSDTTTVENINDSLLVMTSPVMGFNNRLGTLMITYKTIRPNFN